ncbi:alpha/beta hydrolase [Hwanghaeella grinnelliae]|uniref:Alpha/beta hydrolase n=2 Tax=Hwanghaeella grinnelliae TaxID=2500179 RepID=A0A437QR38_9PROT|nr:alpha/beta hydrolase [Hwanghaeella grinnelliae]
MNFTTHDGARIAYRKDGKGPALVLVHGTGGDGESNFAALTALLSDDYTVIRPDYAGSGATVDDGRALTVSYLADQVLATMDALGVRKVHLLGFSLGAAIAAKIAADHPDRVVSLILLAGYASPDARLKLEFELWRDLIARDRHAMARLVLLTGFSPDALASWGVDGVASAVEETLAGADWDGMARQVDLDLRMDIQDILPRIEAPTLVTGCTHDHMVPPAHAKALAVAIRNARYAELPTGHLAPMEQPDLLANQVRAFLSGSSD